MAQHITRYLLELEMLLTRALEYPPSLPLQPTDYFDAFAHSRRTADSLFINAKNDLNFDRATAP